MTRQSATELLVLHAVRLLGFAASDAVAARAGTTPGEALRMLSQAEREGWVQHAAFAGLDGWSLTDTGKVENERQLLAECSSADAHTVVAAGYHDFLPLNARLLRAVTDWQIKPTAVDRFAVNDHADRAWDVRVLDEIAALGRQLRPMNARLASILARFDGYTRRFEAALLKAQNGALDWVDKTDRDSCHSVWFQLHEDLVATLGIDRGEEI